MIPVKPPEVPQDFDQRCRKAGKEWLSSHPASDPHDNPLWRFFRDPLREGFADRCGFSAMLDLDGVVDHWISVKSDRELAYEWTNYRFASGALNSAKKPAWEGRLIDPFEVGEGWFEIILPSLQLVITEKLPDELRDKADFTLEKFRLGNGERATRHRRAWLELYEQGLPLGQLRKVAPLLAQAVEKRLNQGNVDAAST